MDLMNAQEAYEIGVEAYVYFYPLVTMDVTRRQFTNIEAGKMPGRGPMNTFIHIRAYPAADMRVVVRPKASTRCIPWLGSTSPRSRWSSLRRTPGVATIYWRCLTCGKMPSLDPESARRAQRRQTLRLCLRVGRANYRQGCRKFSRQRPTYGLSVGRKPTVQKITKLSTNCRMVTQSLHSPSGAKRRSL